MSGYEEKTIKRLKTVEFAEKKAAERAQKKKFSPQREIAAVIAARENALKSFAYKIAASPQFKPDALTNSELALLLKDLGNGRLAEHIDAKEFNNLLETLIDTTFFERISSEIEKQLPISEVEDLQNLIKTGRMVYEKREVSAEEMQNHLDNIAELKQLEDFYSDVLSQHKSRQTNETSRQPEDHSDVVFSSAAEGGDDLELTEFEEDFVFDVIEEQENINSEQNADAFFTIMTPEQSAIYEKIVDINDLETLSFEERVKALEFFATYPKETGINFEDAMVIFKIANDDLLNYSKLRREDDDWRSSDLGKKIHQNVVKNITAEMAEQYLRLGQATKTILEYTTNNIAEDEAQKDDCKDKIQTIDFRIASPQRDIEFIHSDEYKIIKDELEKQNTQEPISAAEPQPEDKRKEDESSESSESNVSGENSESGESNVSGENSESGESNVSGENSESGESDVSDENSESGESDVSDENSESGESNVNGENSESGESDVSDESNDASNPPLTNEEDIPYKKVVRPLMQEIAKNNDIELKEQPRDENKPHRLSFDTFYSEKAKQDNVADGNISFENRNRAMTTDDFQTVLLAVKAAKKMGAKSIKIGKTNKTHSANMIIAASITGSRLRGAPALEELKDNPKIAIIIERKKLRKELHQLRESLKKENDDVKRAELQKQIDTKVQEGLQMVVDKGSIDARKDKQTAEERLERIKNIAAKTHNPAAPNAGTEFTAAQASMKTFIASQQGRP